MVTLSRFFSKKEPEKKETEEKKKEQVVVKQLKEQISAAKKTAKSETKKTVKKPAKKETPTKKITPPITTLTFDIVTFYGKSVRKVYFDNQWYFSLRDIIAITGELNLDADWDKIKKSKNFEDDQSKYIVQLAVTNNDKNETTECIGYEGVIKWLLPLLRDHERYFPGPFPAWLQSIANAPAPTPAIN
jgi:hypothetical protein